MWTRLRFCSAVPIDLIPCKMDGRDIEAEMPICRSASSEELGKDAGLEGS